MKNLFFMLALCSMVFLALSGCQMSPNLEENLFADTKEGLPSDTITIEDSGLAAYLNSSEVQNTIKGIQVKILAGEIESASIDSHGSKSSLSMPGLSPTGSLTLMENESVTLTVEAGAAAPGTPIVYLWILKKDGNPVEYSMTDTDSFPTAHIITKTVGFKNYGSGVYSVDCQPMMIFGTMSLPLPLDSSNSVTIKFTPPIEINWAKRYIGASFFHSIAPSEDNGWIVAGSYESDTTDFTAELAKLDSSGNVLWSKELGGNKWDGFRKLITTQDNNYLAIGDSNSLGGGNGEWLIKFDDNGKILWEKYLDSLPGQPSVCETSDGSIVVVSSGMYHELCLAKLDASGNLLWQKASPRDMSVIAWDVCADDVGGFVVAASTSVADTGNMDYWILKFNAIGEFEWQKTYGGLKREWISNIYKTSDGYIFGGDTFSFGSNGQDSLLIKIDSQGNIIWQKKIDINQNYEGINALSSNKTGGFVVAVSGTIMNLDANGALISSKSYPAIIQKIVNMPNVGFVAGGYGSGGFVMRLDDNVSCGTYGDDKPVTISDVSVTVSDTNLIISNETRQVVDVTSYKAPREITGYALYPIQ